MRLYKSYREREVRYLIGLISQPNRVRFPSYATNKKQAMNKNGIGPQGLGKKEHNGFWIGSPAKACWKGYERTPGTKKGAQGSCRKK